MRCVKRIVLSIWLVMGILLQGSIVYGEEGERLRGLLPDDYRKDSKVTVELFDFNKSINDYESKNIQQVSLETAHKDKSVSNGGYHIHHSCYLKVKLKDIGCRTISYQLITKEDETTLPGIDEFSSLPSHSLVELTSNADSLSGYIFLAGNDNKTRHILLTIEDTSGVRYTILYRYITFKKTPILDFVDEISGKNRVIPERVSEFHVVAQAKEESRIKRVIIDFNPLFKEHIGGDVVLKNTLSASNCTIVLKIKGSPLIITSEELIIYDNKLEIPISSIQDLVPGNTIELTLFLNTTLGEQFSYYSSGLHKSYLESYVESSLAPIINLPYEVRGHVKVDSFVDEGGMRKIKRVFSSTETRLMDTETITITFYPIPDIA